MRALVVVSFGSSYPDAVRSLDRVEEYLFDRYCRENELDKNDTCLFSSYTSGFIRKKLAGQGIIKKSLEEILNDLCESGCSCVKVQPTHVIPGQEYDKLVDVCESFRDRFDQLAVGFPLIHDADSILKVSETIMGIYGRDADEALLFMGHGTGHLSNFIYPAIQTAFRTLDFDKGYVATVEGWPELKDVISMMKKAGYKKVFMAPLLLIAGNHVLTDMAGDGPDSWKNVLAGEGFEVRYSTEGLSAYEQILDLYL